MNNSIQYFLENGIPGLEKIKKDFFTNPACFDEYIEEVKKIVLDLGCHIISEVLEECNTLLEESLKRRLHWQVKDRSQKNIMSPVGLLSFTRTRFKNKETKETVYLLDRVLGLLPHARMSDGVEAALLEEAVQTSYEKAGKEACPGECVSRETVMRHVRRLEIPAKSQEEPAVKKKTRILYAEADEDHAVLQFHKKKGDIKRFNGHADNKQIVKLVYVHEGYKDSDAERKELKNVVYFGGLYRGKDNEKLWNEVKKYNSEELVSFYNHYVQDYALENLGVQPCIHILDCTKIPVNLSNTNYENSSVVTIDGETMRGYKLGVLRGVMDDSGVAEEIVFGTLKTHDMELCREMLKNTSCFHENDILINDRGFLSREMTNYLKTERKVDTYIPARENMDIFKDAVSLAVSSGKWQKHPNTKRKDQEIQLVKV